MEQQKKTFGALLRTARKRKGMSQPELAAAVGLSPMMISRYENDRIAAPDIGIVMKLCGVLGLAGPEDLGFERTGTRGRAAPKLRSAPTGPTSAREAVTDAEHYLQYLFQRAGLVSEDQQATAAARLDERFPQFGSVTPALVDFWLEVYVRESLPSATSVRRGKSRGQ